MRAFPYRPWDLEELDDAYDDSEVTITDTQ